MRRISISLILIIVFPLSIYPMRYWNMYEIAEINCPDVKFGYAMANGDVNGDGFSDLIVGSYTSLILDKVYIWLGGVSFDTIIDLTFTGKHPFGQAVASGDVNNDGYDDILVGSTPDQGGEVRLYYGGDPMDTIPDWVVHDPINSGWFGYSVALSDLSGDNYPDIIIGVPRAYQQWPYFLGAVYIYWGGDNPDTLCDKVIWGIEESNFGYKVSSRYDVNGDGITDLAVGAPSAPGYFPRISIYYGGAEFDTVPDVKIYNPCQEFSYGSKITLVKDMNGDGYDDLAAGANIHNSVYIYFGDNPMDNQFDAIFSSGDTSKFGMSVVGIDNADGDIYGDILIGSPRYGDTLENGMVYLFRGGSSIDSSPAAYAAGPDSYQIGWCVGYGGDMNNDGKDELIFSNYAAPFPSHKVWIVNYAGVGVEEEKDQRHKTRNIRLLSYLPNPFTTATTIILTLPGAQEHRSTRAQDIELKIYDMSGRLVKDFSLGTNHYPLITGVSWDGKDNNGINLKSGLYFIKFYCEDYKFEETIKIIKLQ